MNFNLFLQTGDAFIRQAFVSPLVDFFIPLVYFSVLTLGLLN